MTIAVSASALKVAIGRISWACEKSVNVPILACYRLKVSPHAGHMDVAANNSDAHISIRVPIHGGDASWITCVNGALLGQILTMSRGGMLSMGMVKEGLQINNRIIPVMNAADFPDDAEPTVDSRITMPAPQWRQMYERLKLAISTEETRYYLNGISLEIADGDAIAVATDGHIMGIQVMRAERSGAWTQQIVPRGLCAGISKVIGKSDESIGLGLSLEPLRLIVVHENVRIVARLIDGEFPDWRRVVPAREAAVIANRAEFVNALNDVRMPMKGAYGVTLAPDNHGISLFTKSPDHGSAAASVTGAFTAPRMPKEIGFQHGYLSQVLKIFDSEQIRLAISDGIGPAIIDDPADADFQIVLMPMRI